MFYWQNLLLMGVMVYVSWSYACAAGLMKPEVDERVDKAMRRRIIIAQSLYALYMAPSYFSTQYWLHRDRAAELCAGAEVAVGCHQPA